MTSPEADAAAPKAGGRPLIWGQLKLVWWARGVVAAFALVGVLDQLGWARENWLRIVHAFGARWNEWMGWLTEAITAALPFSLELTAAEGNTATLLSTLVLPPAWVLVALAVRTTHVALQFAASAVAYTLLVAFVILIAPGDAFETGLLVARVDTLLLLVGMIAAVLPTARRLAGATEVPGRPSRMSRAIRAVCILAGSCLMLYATLGLVQLGLPPSAEQVLDATLEFGLLEAVAIAGAIGLSLVESNRSYVRALVIAATFLLTLEAFYLAPGVEAWLKPFVDWVAPDP